MITKVSAKGQVTIPKHIRDQLGIRPGELLDFKEEGGRIVATKTQSVDPLNAVFGIVDLGESTDDFIEDLRGGREPG